jgi:hypothetical protein
MAGEARFQRSEAHVEKLGSTTYSYLEASKIVEACQIDLKSNNKRRTCSSTSFVITCIYAAAQLEVMNEAPLSLCS